MTYHVTADYSFVLIDREELEAIIETAELLQVPEILDNISQAREESKNILNL